MSFQKTAALTAQSSECARRYKYVADNVGGKDAEMNATYRTNRDDNDFDSYEYALAALKARYANRGVAGEAQSAVAEQKTREAASVRENPEAYRYGEIMEHDRYNRYRTGNGGSVMTVDDVHRIYKDETGKSVTAEVRRAALAAGNDSDARPASPYRVLETRSADSTNSDDFAGKTRKKSLYVRFFRNTAPQKLPIAQRIQFILCFAGHFRKFFPERTQRNSRYIADGRYSLFGKPLVRTGSQPALAVDMQFFPVAFCRTGDRCLFHGVSRKIYL